MQIENFEMRDSLGNYDKILNPNKLNIEEISPNAVSWNYGGQYYEIINDNKLLALLLRNKNQIAVIENLYGKIDDNKAYIINGNNEKKWDVSLLLKIEHRDFLSNKYFIFYDVYYIGKNLFFFVNIHNIDYRFYFNIDNGNVGKLIESR